MSNFKSLQDYFDHDRMFVVPYYQRGYKWSLQINPKRGDFHLNLLLRDLKSEFKLAQRGDKLIENYEYYLQGITVKEKGTEIELVDGQQRTTSLFILFCALKNRNIKLKFNLENKIKYNVRESANTTLQGFISGICIGDECVQDIAALKKAWLICEKEVDEIPDLELFSEFLQTKIKIIYIKLDRNQNEAKVFSMMNKGQAYMTQTELIKSNILREASRQLYEDESEIQDSWGLEWQINQLRSKLAVEWDNWRKWWENSNHSSFGKMISFSSFQEEPFMSGIFELYQKLYDPEKVKISNAELFGYFKDKIADKEENEIEAIVAFEKLRYIQNVLQEWYDDVKVYNYLGLLFKGSGMRNKQEGLVDLVKKYSINKSGFVNELKNEYAKQILQDNTKEQFIASILNDDNVYHNQYTSVARQLLRMNVTRAIQHDQKFDFTLYEEESWREPGDIDNSTTRSIEHIKPQKYREEELTDEEFVKLEALTNTIGNLVLIPKGLNSKLSNEFFTRKKEIIFDEILKPAGKNYGLWLHSLSIFGRNTKFVVNEINKNKDVFKIEFNDFFKSVKL